MQKKTIGLALLGLTVPLSAMAAAAKEADKPYEQDIEEVAESNQHFRHVLFTGKNLQLTAMSLKVGEEIGVETHGSTDQCLFVAEGQGETVIEGATSKFSEGDVVCVPAGTKHNIRNTSKDSLKLYTIYGPPQHPKGAVHHTKADAERAESGDKK